MKRLLDIWNKKDDRQQFKGDSSFVEIPKEGAFLDNRKTSEGLVQDKVHHRPRHTV